MFSTFVDTSIHGPAKAHKSDCGSRWRHAAGASHSVQHAQVVRANEGGVLRLNGAFGPLQDMTVVGV